MTSDPLSGPTPGNYLGGIKVEPLFFLPGQQGVDGRHANGRLHWLVGAGQRRQLPGVARQQRAGLAHGRPAAVMVVVARPHG